MIDNYFNNYSWHFNVGDLVLHDEYGSGIVEYRTVMSYHEMARPVRIVEKEIYKVMFPDPHGIKSIFCDDLSIIQKESTFQNLL